MQFLRVFGYVLPQNKKLQIALTQVFGLGKKFALKILALLNINVNKKVYEVNSKQLQELYFFIEKQKCFENFLRKIINNNIDRLKYIRSYRGARHVCKLPTRGQRTKTNAQTSKKKRFLNSSTIQKKLWKKK